MAIQLAAGQVTGFWERQHGLWVKSSPSPVLPFLCQGEHSRERVGSLQWSVFLKGAVVWFFQDLAVRMPHGAARWNQNIPGGSQELQAQAGLPRRGLLQELVTSQHMGTQLVDEILQGLGSP